MDTWVLENELLFGKSLIEVQAVEVSDRRAEENDFDLRRALRQRRQARSYPHPVER